MAAEGRGDFAEPALELAATVGERALMPRADMSRAWRERPFSTFVATGGGVGMIPFAPGTWGSVEGLVLGWCMVNWTGRLHSTSGPLEVDYGISFPEKLVLLGVCGAIGIAIGTISSSRAERFTEKDPGAIVIDEVVGQFIALSPLAFVRGAWKWSPPISLFLLSFGLFRLFDIWKPGLIRKLQDLRGGWGIMLDDVAAGILAGAITYGIGRTLQ